jgi:hypothetical protein
MNLAKPRHLPQRVTAAAALLLLLILNTAALSGPGAHGPNGEHLDAPSTTRAASAVPRLEARSEAFELVAELRAAELAIIVDRYETNEPVLGAKLEVDSGAVKAVAVFRPEQGDYAVTDAALLTALAAPGEHGMVFTLLAGAQSDLLDGTLVVNAGGIGQAAARNRPGHSHEGHDHDHDHDHALERAAWIGGGLAALGLLGLLAGVAWWRQRRSRASLPQGAQ